MSPQNRVFATVFTVFLTVIFIIMMFVSPYRSAEKVKLCDAGIEFTGMGSLEISMPASGVLKIRITEIGGVEREITYYGRYVVWWEE